METMETLGMPQNEFAEKAVLGCILLDSNVLLNVAAILRPEDFYRDSHRKIYSTLFTMNEANQPIDTFLLTNTLRDQGLLEAMGGTAYIMDLYETVPSVANVVSYAKIIKDCAVKRQLIAFADKLGRDAKALDGEAIELIETAESEIYEMGQSSSHSSLEHIGPIVGEAFDSIGKEESGVPTFKELDRILNGLHKTDMIVIAARPGMGKTTFCINLAEQAATRHKASVAFFSLEMSNIQLAMRMLVSRARVSAEHIRKANKLTTADMDKLTKAMEEISEANIYLDDTPGITVAEIRGKARRLQKEKGLDLLVIDYIGLMQSSVISKNENRQQQISEISRQLKGLAKELNVPLIAISQLSRAAVKSGAGENVSTTKPPDLSHLRDSGAIEQDADIVIFIHRPSYYTKNNGLEQDENVDDSLAQIIVAKHRNGEVGMAEMSFIHKYTAFMERERHHQEEPIPIPPEIQAGYVESNPPDEAPPEIMEQHLPLDEEPPF